MKLVEPETAAALIPDGATVIFGGSGAGHAVPQNVIDSLARVFTETGRPRDLTTVRVVGIGDFAEKGFSQLALPGLMRRTIGSNLGNEPGLARLVAVGEVNCAERSLQVDPGSSPRLASIRTSTRATLGANKGALPKTSSNSSISAARSGFSTVRFRSTWR